MIVAGFGFRASAPLAAFEEVAKDTSFTHIAALAEKADHPTFRDFAAAHSTELCLVESVEGIETGTSSPRIKARFGTGSLCEALALKAAGVAGRATLLQTRRISRDGTVTMAIAEGHA
ncbi:cobalamin biosynthesis protein [Pseudaestuariivita sp.]|uniref:cobalamin biosynthesis protein n=1 Tax=Pseudaestuariivita sp. TaxID=2211669 RepID=UPI00405957D6